MANRSKTTIPALVHFVTAEVKREPKIGGRRLAQRARHVGFEISHPTALKIKKEIMSSPGNLTKSTLTEILQNRKVSGDKDPEPLEAPALVRDPQFEIVTHEPANPLDFQKGLGTQIPDRELYKIVPSLREPATWKERMMRKQELKQKIQTVPRGLRTLLNTGSNTLRRLGFSPKKDPELGAVLGNFLRSTWQEMDGKTGSSQQVVNLALRLILVQRFGPGMAERYLSKLPKRTNEIDVGVGSRGELVIE